MNFNNFLDEQKQRDDFGKPGKGFGYNPKMGYKPKFDYDHKDYKHYDNYNHDFHGHDYYPYHGYGRPPVVINQPTGLPFLTGLATGAILSPGQSYAPYPTYPPQYPYPQYPYPQYPNPQYPQIPYPPYPQYPYQEFPNPPYPQQ